MVEFQQKRLYVKVMIEKSLSNINLSFNLWISKNFDNYIANITHFINETHMNQMLIIRLYQVLE